MLLYCTKISRLRGRAKNTAKLKSREIRNFAQKKREIKMIAKFSFNKVDHTIASLLYLLFSYSYNHAHDLKKRNFAFVG